ncbi:MAG: hypothetical protein Q4C64_08350 [Erysipelotrichia bacterium]|nr:hypothetical protein [Erysipelotrichia bacterium]
MPEFDLNKYLASVGIDQFMGLKGKSDDFIFRQNMLDAYKKEYIANGGKEKEADLYA